MLEAYDGGTKQKDFEELREIRRTHGTLTGDQMQKVINILAVVSFVGVTGIIGGGATVYLRRDTIIEDVKGKITACNRNCY